MFATDEARAELGPARVRWVGLERVGDPETLPEPPAEAGERDTEEIKQAPASQAYRSWFWSLDIDPTKRRPAGEALGRRLAHGGLPEIHPLVDAYNLASAITLVPLSAFDRASLAGELRLDVPRPGDALDAIGETDPVDPTGQHPVWRDEEGLVGLAAYRDGKRTALGLDSQRAIVVSIAPEGVATEHLDRAFDLLAEFAEEAGWRVEKPEEREIE